MRPFRIAVLVLACGGCGGLVSSLSKEEYARLPREARVSVYDAENDVVIAASRSDEAKRVKAALERELDELSDRIKRAETRLKAAGHGDWISGVKQMFGARKQFLEAQSKVAKASIRTAEGEIALARARREREKQRQLLRIGQAAPASLVAFESEVTAGEKRVKELERRELDERAETQKVFEKWKSAEDEYARSTGDHDSGIWIE